MQLDQHFLNTVRAAVNTAWQQIAWDVDALCESNEEAVEMCLDADRLLINAEDQVAHAAVKMAVQANGYQPTLQFLAQNISLK